ncbi:MAG: methyltransferase domain-containing protein [Saprospiraceae bacterium]|nr:methyltransferase domain-containing protein [Saprospiraceae bacterium]
MAQYSHNTGFHNLIAPREIVPVIMDLVKPNSVIDIGCGLGTFIKVFKDQGVKKIFGIDGPWCDKSELFKNIDENEFEVKDLEKNLGITEKYDLAVCLEVAEHLTPGRAESFIGELTNMSDVVLFSAAVPNQGGDHHYNEQWLTYWEVIFNMFDFEVHDVLRGKFWDNPNVYWWYKQNMVLAVKKGHDLKGFVAKSDSSIRNIVHPELFMLVNDYKDKNALKRYLKLLYKALLFKLGLAR